MPATTLEKVCALYATGENEDERRQNAAELYERAFGIAQKLDSSATQMLQGDFDRITFRLKNQTGERSLKLSSYDAFFIAETLLAIDNHAGLADFNAERLKYLLSAKLEDIDYTKTIEENAQAYARGQKR